MPEDELLVADAGPLVALFRVGSADLLTTVARRIVVPRAVFDELAAGPADEASAVAARSSLPPWLEVLSNRAVLPAVQAFDLGPGETAALAEAMARPLAKVLIDERDGRDAALALGIPLVGSLGVMLAAKRAGRLPAIAPLVRHLVATDYHYAPALIRKVLVEAGEAD